MLQEDILPDIDSALNGGPIDPDDWESGTEIYLTIGPSISVLDDANGFNQPATIPTQDIKEIIEAWVDWIVTNKLEKYMFYK